MARGTREKGCEKHRLEGHSFVDRLWVEGRQAASLQVGGWIHSLVWVSWCLSSFERWLKAFPQAVQS